MIPLLQTHIQCPRALLRPWRPTDRAALLRHADDPEVARNLRALPRPYDDAAAAAWLGEVAADPPPPGVWAIEVSGEAAGCIALERGSDIEAASFEVGYWLGRAY